MKTKRDTTQIDAAVGKRLRMRRTLLGLSQEGLAQEAGVSFQQIQKYEKGHNRISCSRLVDLARILDVDASFFFDDIALPAPALDSEDNIARNKELEKDSARLMRYFRSIHDAALRKKVLKVVAALADDKKYDGME